MDAPDQNTKPRVLIVDDSRIVRASLIKHIRGRFDFREAADGETGWEIIVLDPTIQVVISDLTMPKLGGYALLERMRTSKISRIKTLPCIMLSGSDDEEERNRAIERGATDLVAKGIGATELVSRLDIMMRLSDTQRKLDESQEKLSKSAMVDPRTGLSTSQLFAIEAEKMLAYAARHGVDLSIMSLRIDQEGENPDLAPMLLQPLAKLLKQAVRREDSVAQVGELQFLIAAQAITHEAAMSFARRLCAAIGQARVTQSDSAVTISASLGVASLLSESVTNIDGLCAIAVRRCEQAHIVGGNRVMGVEHDKNEGGQVLSPEIDVATALMMLANDQVEAVRPHLRELARQLKPLLDLLDTRRK